jgi:hypothetical protein
VDIQSKKCYELHIHGGKHRWVVSSKKHKKEWAANAAVAAAKAGTGTDHSERQEGINTVQHTSPSSREVMVKAGL